MRYRCMGKLRLLSLLTNPRPVKILVTIKKFARSLDLHNILLTMYNLQKKINHALSLRGRRGDLLWYIIALFVSLLIIIICKVWLVSSFELYLYFYVNVQSRKKFQGGGGAGGSKPIPPFYIWKNMLMYNQSCANIYGFNAFLRMDLNFFFRPNNDHNDWHVVYAWVLYITVIIFIFLLFVYFVC